MGQHMKRAHPVEYCEIKEPSTVRSKARWTVEEMALVINEMNKLEENLSMAEQNRRLALLFCGRTAEKF